MVLSDKDNPENRIHRYRLEGQSNLVGKKAKDIDDPIRYRPQYRRDLLFSFKNKHV